MRLNVYYGTEPRITDADRHNYDRRNYECAMVMKDREGQPVIVSRSKDPTFPVLKVECGFSCFAFMSKAEAMAFCEKRYRKARRFEMINSIRYHPLIERDDETHEYAPLFVSTDEAAVRKAHACYLEEFINGYYRLCAGKTGTLPHGGKMTIACPVCGSHLKNITAGNHKPQQALYMPCLPQMKGRYFDYGYLCNARAE